MYSQLRTLRLTLVGFALLFSALSGPGCSSKSADPDTAEVVPDPVIKPAPAAKPPLESTPKSDPSVPPTAETKP